MDLQSIVLLLHQRQQKKLPFWHLVLQVFMKYYLCRKLPEHPSRQDLWMTRSKSDSLGALCVKSCLPVNIFNGDLVLHSAALHRKQSWEWKLFTGWHWCPSDKATVTSCSLKGEQWCAVCITKPAGSASAWWILLFFFVFLTSKCTNTCTRSTGRPSSRSTLEAAAPPNPQFGQGTGKYKA